VPRIQDGISALGTSRHRVVPLDLALEAAQEAVKTCEGNGYRATATVVDIAGTPKVILRGDRSTVHNVMALPGAVSFMSRGEMVAALGVGGAPGGDKDEVCAPAGVAKARDRLPH
jgi:uncharacterized protein GlcG (DUF336 family)